EATYITKVKKQVQDSKKQIVDSALNIPDNANDDNIAIAKRAETQEIDAGNGFQTDVAPNKIIVSVDNTTVENTQNIKSSYAILTTTVDENYSNDDSERKNKLRGIFRRVSRVFNKPSEDDDNNKRSVAIGSFQIALK
ncbi:MAG TPA: hypothetical protein VMT76_01500, partial [Puia sp.]|nr:hypothetical protein [Puia sp.]